MTPVNLVTGPATGPRSARAGRMTAAMRAIQPASGSRVLRIGLVVGGRLLEERIIKRRTTVTVGPEQRCTFVLEADVPPRFKLFELVDGGYVLNVLGGMSGRVALGAGLVELSSLHRGAGPAGATYPLPLTESARGKVVVGDATFLFQFVAPPPAQPRPQLPLAVKGGLAASIDWRFTIIAAFTFLGHFGVVGALYSDWTDPVVDEDVTAGLLEMVQRTRPEAIPVGDVDALVAARATLSVVDARPAPTATARPAPREAPSRPSTPDPRAVENMLSSVDRVRIAILTAVDPGRALAVATSPGSEGPPVDLRGLAERPEGVDSTPGGLHLPQGSGPLQVGQTLQDLRPTVTVAVSSTAGRVPAIAPKFDVQYPAPTISVPVANAEAVIRTQIHPGARRCYEKGLDSDPGQSGRLVLQIKVAPNGEVDFAGATTSGGLSAGVVDCVAQVARRVRFDAPGASGSTLSVPFNFVRQGR